MPKTTKKCIYLSKDEADLISMSMYNLCDYDLMDRKHNDCEERMKLPDHIWKQSASDTKHPVCDKCDTCIDFNKKYKIYLSLSTKFHNLKFKS